MTIATVFYTALDPGTPASYLKDSTNEEIKKDRLQEIQNLISEQGKNHTHALMNSEQKVLIDEKVDASTFKGRQIIIALLKLRPNKIF